MFLDALERSHKHLSNRLSVYMGKPHRPGLKVSTVIHVEALIPLPQVLFPSANVSALLGILKVRRSTKFHEKQFTFELDMICFLFFSDFNRPV